jgi:hypothetical protein
MSAQHNLGSANLQFSVGPELSNHGVHQNRNTCGWRRIALIWQQCPFKIRYVTKPRKTFEESMDERIWLLDDDGTKLHEDICITMRKAFNAIRSTVQTHTLTGSPTTPSLHAEWSLTRRIATVRLCNSQPSQNLIRDRARWRGWLPRTCVKNYQWLYCYLWLPPDEMVPARGLQWGRHTLWNN